jgi:hypothetical protein
MSFTEWVSTISNGDLLLLVAGAALVVWASITLLRTRKVHDSGLPYRPANPTMPDIGGDKMTIEAFKEAVDAGAFIDSDGHGYYATEDKESRIPAYPSDVKVNLIDREYTHVVWYNR